MVSSAFFIQFYMVIHCKHTIAIASVTTDMWFRNVTTASILLEQSYVVLHRSICTETQRSEVR